MKLTFATLLTSFFYFGLMKYVCDQPANVFTKLTIISSSLMFLVIMIVIILEAVKEELLDDEDTEIFL
jgi:hypothetical protein